MANSGMFWYNFPEQLKTLLSLTTSLLKFLTESHGCCTLTGEERLQISTEVLLCKDNFYFVSLLNGKQFRELKLKLDILY